MDLEPFCQAIAVPLALAALRRAGILRVRATEALSGPLGEPAAVCRGARLCPRCAIWWWMCPARGRNWRRGRGRSMARRCSGPAGGGST